MNPKTAKRNHGRPLHLVGLAVLLTSGLASCATLSPSSTTRQPIQVNFPTGGPQRTTVDYPGGKSGPQPASPDRRAATQKQQPPQQVPVAVTTFSVPKTANTAVSKKPLTTDQSEQIVKSANTNFIIHPENDDYHGGAVVYNYIPNHVYQLFTAPLQLTDVALEAGEKIVSAPAAGDTSNFLLATTYNMHNGKKRQHVLVKPLYPNKQTTIVINTDKRTYTFQVYSLPKTYMPLVSFTYPMEFAQQQQQAANSAAQAIPTAAGVTGLDFNYKIIPHTLNLPAWAPSIVFNDGVKTYIDFPSAERAAYAPVLFALNKKGKRVIVNYRVKGTYYIVDRVLNVAELALNTNDGNVITIKRTGN